MADSVLPFPDRGGDSKNVYRQRGFTVLEVAIVAAIIAILAAMLTPVAVNMMDKADITRAQADINALITALENFKADTKEYPTRRANGTANWVRVLYSGENWPGGATFASGVNYGNNRRNRLWEHFIENGSDRYAAWNSVTMIGWHGPYLSSDILDPWGRPYIIATRAFSSPGTTFYAWILSAGPDGQFQTDDENTTVRNGDDIGKWIYH